MDKVAIYKMAIFENVRFNLFNKKIPDIMYFGSDKRVSDLRGRVFLSPHIGIASMFIIPKGSIKSLKGYSYNKEYEEWNYPNSKLQQPLSSVNIRHNVPNIKKEETGESSGYIYKINVSKVKDKLRPFVTNNMDREVIYEASEPLEIIEVIPHRLKWISKPK